MDDDLSRSGSAREAVPFSVLQALGKSAEYGAKTCRNSATVVVQVVGILSEAPASLLPRSAPGCTTFTWSCIFNAHHSVKGPSELQELSHALESCLGYLDYISQKVSSYQAAALIGD